MPTSQTKTATRLDRMANLWYRVFHRFCNAVYFNRITVVHPERLPRTGPVFYLGLHRNGAVDGFIYHVVVPKAAFLISTQLRRNPLGKLFFTGIEIVRTKDAGDREVNAAALGCCRDHLFAGGSVFVFPEGTSSLGPRHLPFKSGAIQILLDYLDSGGGPVPVIPLGIHYECPWAFRANVEVVVGKPVSIDQLETLTPLGRLKEMKRRTQAGLEAVGVNVPSAACQDTIQRLAYVATLATPRSYFQTIKRLETEIPTHLLARWQSLEPELGRRKLWYHQGVPLFPMGPLGLYALALAALAPLVLAGALLNLPPLVAGYWAGRRFPDGPNVISLWRILVGVPVFILWAVTVVAVTLGLGQGCSLAGYLLVTWLALKNYYRVKKLAVAVHNGCRHADLRPTLLAFRELVLQEIPNEPA